MSREEKKSGFAGANPAESQGDLVRATPDEETTGAEKPARTAAADTAGPVASPAPPASPATPAPTHGGAVREDPANVQDPAGFVAPLASLGLALDDGRRMLFLPRGCAGLLAPRAPLLAPLLDQGIEVGIGCFDTTEQMCYECMKAEKALELGYFCGHVIPGGYEA